MEIEYRKSGANVTVFLFGEIDHHNAQTINQKIDKIIESEGAKHLVLDFHKVSFMDSSGIGVVLGRYKRMTARAGKISMIGATPLIKKIFVLSGVDKLIDIS